MAIADGRNIITPQPPSEDMMSIPGFINDYVDFILSVSVYQNKSMAFAGALSMMAHLMGRNVKDVYDSRTNLYVLGLAQSGAGKDSPRKVNKRLATAVNISKNLGDTLASREGLEDALEFTPTMLYQTDEVDSLMQGFASGKDARMNNLMSGLMSLYTASCNSLKKRRLASKGPVDTEIMAPHLTIFGTAIPNNYYSSLCEKMLSNGFLARNIVIEDVSTRTFNESETLATDQIPEHLLEQAQFWAEFNTAGMVEIMMPDPMVMTHTPKAKILSKASQDMFSAKWDDGKAKSDTVLTSVWARAWENANKLAMIYAGSRDYKNPVITEDAVLWAEKFVDTCCERMVYQASSHVFENTHDKHVKKVFSILSGIGDKSCSSLGMSNACSKRDLLRKIHGLKVRDLDDVLSHMESSEIIMRADGGRTIFLQTLSPETTDN